MVALLKVLCFVMVFLWFSDLSPAVSRRCTRHSAVPGDFLMWLRFYKELSVV